ncbi:Dyp-type peroxidase [Microbacterium sp. ARD32]|uniref:Dyp-type peroxidase n=1 Tax=Microbacterium sp. ARD32 TaxID=2962577 RepID=UPI0028826D58|nr:Dyp-type peroxidase [Microbacterium sp. ARD32]MDT0156473.1 Dyp-type peroxidase [Microbacterium sp. ARD32]
MTSADREQSAASGIHRPSGPTRRQLLLGGAAAGAGAAAALGIDRLVAAAAPAPEASPAPPALHGGEVVAFHGVHQAGIATVPQAHATVISLDLRPGVERDGLRRLMRLLTDDAVRLTAGTPALADMERELALEPAGLTVTFGFGPGFVQRAGGSGPDWLAPLPSFGIDRLRAEFTGGDLLIQVAADDPLSVAHTARMLLKDARAFATVRWVQHGFRRARGTVAQGTTMRNLFGQVDGTANLRPGTEEFDRAVWCREDWIAGGTGMVVRRIAMNLDTWDGLDRTAREFAIGRTLDTGAPLTGEKEHDEPDFEARGPRGFPVIDDLAHIRRAHATEPGERIFRRVYNYDAPPAEASAVSESGLVFISFQADIQRQFTPMQQRLAQADLLNIWTTPIGSAVFAVPPGCDEGGYIGETLLE